MPSGEARRRAIRAPVNQRAVEQPVALRGVKRRGRDSTVLDPVFEAEADRGDLEGADAGGFFVVVPGDPIRAGGGDGGDRGGVEVAELGLLRGVEVQRDGAAGAGGAHDVEDVAVFDVGAGPGGIGAGRQPVVRVGEALVVPNFVRGRTDAHGVVEIDARSAELRDPAVEVNGNALVDDDVAIETVGIPRAGAAVGGVVGLRGVAGLRLERAAGRAGGLVIGFWTRQTQGRRDNAEREGGLALGVGGVEIRDAGGAGLDFRIGVRGAGIVGEVDLEPQHALGAVNPRGGRGERRKAGCGRCGG